MPFVKRSPPDASRVVRKRLADGTIKEYRYGKRKPSAPRHAADSMGRLEIAWLASREWAALAPATRAAYTTYLRVLGRAPNILVKDYTRRMLAQVASQVAKTRGDGAGSGFLRTASSMFRWAVKHQWIETNPAIGIDPMPGGHLPAWTEEQAAKALAELPEAYRRVVVLGLHTAQRRGDLVRMPWSAYDGFVIRIQQEKTKVLVVVPVHPDLKVELDRWKASATSTMILTTARGIPWNATHLSDMLPKALRRIGLPAGLNVHGLRKLAATRLAEAGCSAHEIASITGHKSLSMVQLYTASVSQEKLAHAAISRLQFAENKPTKKRR